MNGKEFGERMLAAVKDFVNARVGAVAQDMIALGRRQSSTDQLLDDLSQRIEALEKAQREAAAPKLRQVG
jgi:hypothetical protein